jgi:hypothetical protein
MFFVKLALSTTFFRPYAMAIEASIAILLVPVELATTTARTVFIFA